MSKLLTHSDPSPRAPFNGPQEAVVATNQNLQTTWLRCFIFATVVWLFGVYAIVAVAQQEQPAVRASAPTASSRVSELDQALETFREADGKTPQELRDAWRAVANANREDVISILVTIDASDEVTVNWLSTAIDAIFDSERGKWTESNLEQLVYYCADEQRQRLSRKTAYDLLSRIAPDRANELVPKMVDDPVAEFRRPGVAQLIEEAQKLTEDEADTAAQLAAYQKALDHARAGDQVRTIAAALADLESPIVLADHFGFIRQWAVIGPFANVDSEGFERDFAPESLADADTLIETIKRGDAYDGKEGEVRWHSFESSADTGEVDLNEAIAPETEVVGYGAAIVEMDRTQDVQLRLHLQNAFKIWVNGELVLAQPIGHTGNSFDQYQVETQLQKGKNLILVKSCQVKPLQEIDFFKVWHFGVRVSDSTGGALPFVNAKVDAE